MFPRWFEIASAWLAALCGLAGAIVGTLAVMDWALARVLQYYEVWGVVRDAMFKYVRERREREEESASTTTAGPS
jgi:hypothetical protein